MKNWEHIGEKASIVMQLQHSTAEQNEGSRDTTETAR